MRISCQSRFSPPAKLACRTPTCSSQWGCHALRVKYSTYVLQLYTCNIGNSILHHLLTLVADNMFQESASVSAPLRPAQDTTKMPPPSQNILLASREGKASSIFDAGIFNAGSC
jgi:hypothetical protein